MRSRNRRVNPAAIESRDHHGRRLKPAANTSALIKPESDIQLVVGLRKLYNQYSWKTDTDNADLLPTVNMHQVSAVGSLAGYSAFFQPDGRLIGTYGQAAIFAEYPDGGWAALSDETIARLSPAGDSFWSHVISPPPANRHQPLVDSRGHIYAIDGESILAFDAAGHKVFELNVGQQPGPLFPIRDGMFATVVGSELCFIV